MQTGKIGMEGRSGVRRREVLTGGGAVILSACSHTPAQPAIGVSFETLDGQYWRVSRDVLEAELRKRGVRMVTAVAEGDVNRQFEQVRSFISRQLDGIIIVPKDAQTVIPMIREANRASIPIVLFNRPPAQSDAKSVSVVADNFAIARKTVAYLAEQALRVKPQHKAAILIGDLGDINAFGRRDGFEEALRAHGKVFQVVARILTEWTPQKAFAGLSDTLRTTPDLSFIFVSSDHLLPSVVKALQSAGKYHKHGESGHIFLAGFDGDATAWRLLEDGYVDAVGVQDVYFDSEAAVQAVLDLKAGKPVPERILDKGFVIHRDNMATESRRMWGANVAKS